VAKTTTARFGLFKPTPGTAEPVNSFIDENTNSDTIDANLGTFVCTSSTRPTGIQGRLIFETDTGAVRVYDGSKWVLVNPIQQFAYTSATESTSSGTYVDLTTVGPAVTLYMTAGQRAEVTTKARQTPGASSTSFMSYAVSGTETVAAPNAGSSIHEQEVLNGTGEAAYSVQSTFVASAADGNRTFTAKYRAGSASAVTFRNRYLSVRLLSN